MLLVEVILYKGIDLQIIVIVVQLVKWQGKMLIVVVDKVGFYVNCIFVLYINEVMCLLVEGELIEVIDNVLVKFGFLVGLI